MEVKDVAGMPAGRDMDVLVHRSICRRGCRFYTPTEGPFRSDLAGWYDYPLSDNPIGLPMPVPRYSTDVGAAWEVLARCPHQWSIRYDPGGWGVVEVHVPAEDSGDDDASPEWFDHAAKFNHPGEAAAAICRAMLKAAG